MIIKLIIGSVILSIVIAIIVTIIDYKMHEDDEYEELTPKEKMYQAITTLAYVLIAVIVIAVIIKILFWAGVIAAIKDWV